MANGIYAALAGATAQARALEVVSNNLANSDSTGFKADRLSFREVLSGVVDATHRQVTVDGVVPDFSSGPMNRTGNPLDAAVLGPGFFVVQTANGERYTRAGSFAVSPAGELATQDGDPVLGRGGPIALGDAGAARIERDGSVRVDGRVLGTLRVVEFDKPEALGRDGHTLWRAIGGNNRARDIDVDLEPGALERSNVNPISGMTEMIMIARAYEMFHRSIEIYRSTDEKTTSALGR
jgi:flagellar basal-body rod protein FlgF